MRRGLIAAALLAVLHPGVAHAEELFALTATGAIERFDSQAPSTIIASVPITGLQTGESLLGIDFRPLTGQLYGIGSTSRLYRVDVTTGVASAIGASPFTPALNGSHVAVDFDPTADRLRCVSDAGQNLRLSPDSGAVSGNDTNLAYGLFDPRFGTTPHIVALAHSDDTDVTATTTLYGIDSTHDTLVTLGAVDGSVAPNDGTLFTVGALGVDATDAAGFDISGQTGVAYAALTLANSTTGMLFTVNLSTGSVTAIGAIGGGVAILDIAVAPAPIVFDMVALRTDGRLLRFDTRTPTVATTPLAVTGLQGGEILRAIDYRPSTGRLYGLGDTARLYTVDPVHGVATAVGGTPLSPLPTTFTLGLTFDPVGERLHLLDQNGQNFSIDADTGAVAAVDTPLSYAVGDPNFGTTPEIVAATFTTVVPPATSAVLYGIDTNLSALVTMPVPSNGQLVTVGDLNANVGTASGFDVAASGTAFAVFDSTLYTLDLTTRALTQVGVDTIAGGGTIRRIAAVPPAGQAVLEFAAAPAPVREGQTGVVTVTRSGASAGVATVDFAITGGTATLGSDYTLAGGTLTFVDGETSRSLALAALVDQTLELFETVTVALSNPVGAVLGAQTTLTIDIADLNDGDGDGFPDAVEVAAGTDPADPSSTPFGGQPAGPSYPLTVTAGQIKLNFAHGGGTDTLSCSGAIPTTLPTITAGQLIVDVGSVVGANGVIQVFTLDEKGRSTPKGLHVSKPRKGIAKFTVTLKRGSFAPLLAGAGLTNADLVKVALPMDFSVYYQTQHLAVQKTAVYSAKTGRKGIAVVQRSKQ